ncbi:MAG: PAS domain S-box protein [Gemmatimonadota bacterium]
MSDPNQAGPPSQHLPRAPSPPTLLALRERIENDEHFRELMADLLQIFWIRDAVDNSLVYVSPSFERISGRTCQSLYDDNASLLDAIHPEDRKRMAQVIGQISKTEGYEEEFRLVRPAGEVRWIWARGYPVRDKHGTIRRFVGIAEDITEQKASEKNRSRAGGFIEYTGDTVVCVTADGTVVSWSDGATRTYGYTSDAMLGSSFSRLFPPDQYQAYRPVMDRAVNGESVPAQETVRRRKDGSLITLTVSIVPVDATAGDLIGVSKTGHDVTTIKKLEAQFIEAQKMEAVGQLASGVAHDFNNILGVIIGYTDIILEALGPEHALHGDAKEVRTAAERAAGLTRQLLIFSRKQTVQPVVLELDSVVKDLDGMLRHLIDEHIILTVDRDAQAGSINADAGYIGQVLLNLVVNARDAMPDGGTLAIATKNVTLDASYALDHPGVPPGAYVMLSVSDTGTGMSDHIKSHLFEAFFTTKSKGKGTGLGLTSCQTIVRLSGGHIEVQSELGRGTIFRVYLPRVDQPAEPTVGSERGRTRLPRGSETLLVVEDEPSVRHLAVAILEGQGYRVLSASNGQEGLRVAREHEADAIRLVITDVIMPQMGGKVMAEWLKTTYPDLKVLFTSGYTDDAIEHHGVLEPGVAFLPKPYTPATLARQVREMLDAPLHVQGAS